MAVHDCPTCTCLSDADEHARQFQKALLERPAEEHPVLPAGMRATGYYWAALTRHRIGDSVNAVLVACDRCESERVWGSPNDIYERFKAVR